MPNEKKIDEESTNLEIMILPKKIDLLDNAIDKIGRHLKLRL